MTEKSLPKRGIFTMPATRSTGRKIDTWRYNFSAGGSAEIDVSLHTGSGTPLFEASSSHPRLKHLTWKDSDIATLSEKVQQDIETMLTEIEGDAWQDAFVLTLTPKVTNRGEFRATSFELASFPVQTDTRIPRGNDGSVRILRDGSITSVKERAFSDETSQKFGGKHYQTDSQSAKTVVPAGPETGADIHLLQDCLSEFSRLLATALSPGRADTSRIPKPAELVEMMSRACDIICDRASPETPSPEKDLK